MTQTSRTNPSFPLKAVIVTFVITALLAGGSVRLLSTRGTTVDSHENHEKTLYTCSMHPFVLREEPGTCPLCGMDLVPKSADAPTQTSKERVIAYWKAPMNPREIYDEPGKSAMGMDLVPVYEDQLVGGVDIAIDPVMRQAMGVRVAPARTGPLTHTIRTYGHITYDETRTADVSPRFGGWIEELHVNETGQQVKKGQALFSVYSPELISAQEEYLGAFRSAKARPGDSSVKSLLQATKSRLVNYGLPSGEITDIEKGNVPKTKLTLYSPMDGVVVDKKILEGSSFMAGTRLYTLSDLSVIWVEAHVYEYELSLVKLGQEATITLPYQPGKVYRGKVSYIYPYLQAQTRDVVVRLAFDNPGFELKPEMYADVSIRTQPGKQGILIPEEALIRSGEQNLVFVDKGDGTFVPRSVTPGLSMDNGDIHILEGIAPQDRVVVSGQFLLDSESKLQEALRKMTQPDPPVEEQEADDDSFFDDM